jgi:phosphoglycerate kinase
MDFDKLQHYRIVNLSRQLQGPTLIRVDINLPASHGMIEEDALRMRVYAHVLELYSDYAGLAVMAHQGRKGDDDFTPLSSHARMLRKLLPRDVDVEFVPHDTLFTSETKSKVSKLQKRQVLVLDNMRYFEEEKKWNPTANTYVPFFKGVVRTCVNDSIPTWHRTDSSLMCLPFIAPTLVGLRSSYEFRILREVMESKEPKALIMGGSKLQKVSDLLKIGASGVEIFTGGLPGQLIARARGHDLGETNNRFVEQKFSGEEFEEAKRLDTLLDGREGMKVHHPLDFIVEEAGARRNVKLSDLPSCKGVIKDIGEETLEVYAALVQEKPIRIRAGPLGVYEESYQNGLELTRRIGGDGLIFLGGDTSQELNEGGLLGHIEDSGGRICVSGGSFLHGWAGGTFPSLEELVLQQPAPVIQSSR